MAVQVELSEIITVSPPATVCVPVLGPVTEQLGCTSESAYECVPAPTLMSVALVNEMRVPASLSIETTPPSGSRSAPVIDDSNRNTPTAVHVTVKFTVDSWPTLTVTDCAGVAEQFGATSPRLTLYVPGWTKFNV